MKLYDNHEHRRDVTIYGDKLLGEKGVVFTDFLVSVKFTPKEIPFMETMPDAKDIRFTNEAQNVNLYFEIEEWDRENSRGVIWVTVPKLIVGQETKIKMFWGKDIKK